MWNQKLKVGGGAAVLILVLAGSTALPGPWPWGCGDLSAQQIPIPLDTLTVQVGSRVRSRLPVLTRSIELLERDEIRSLPVRTVSGLLEWATGVEILSRSPAQNDLSVRGAGFEQVLVLVNGVRMSDPQTGHFDLDLAVPLEEVERVEILRGPASAFYGADAVGGVVNIVTSQGVPGARARMEGGSWGTARMSAEGGVEGGGGGSFQASGELARSDGHRAGTDYETALLHLSGGHPLGQGRLQGELGLSRKDFGARDFYAPYPSFERTRTYTSSIRWGSAPGKALNVEAGGAFRQHEDDFVLIRDNPAVYRNRHTSSQSGADLALRTTPRSGLDLAFGGEVFWDFLRSNSLGDRTERRGAVFGEMVMGKGRAGALSVGLREDWHQGFGAFFSPSVSASYSVGPSLRLRTALGRSFRAPTWTERYYQDPANVGRADLLPERAWSGEIGADVTGGSAVGLSLTAFLRRSSDLIDWARAVDAPEGAPWETRNVKEATFEGLEADLAVSGPWESQWSVGGSLLSLATEDTRGLVSKYALRPLRERLVVGVRRSFGSRFSVGLQAQRGRRAGEDPFHRVDLRTSVRLGSAWLYLDGTNLADEAYPDITGAAAPGRALFLGIQVGASGAR